jgi:hypothetical protein
MTSLTASVIIHNLIGLEGFIYLFADVFKVLQLSQMSGK